jgi:hypothetical protein
MRMKGIKDYLAVIAIAFGLCVTTWGMALWLTGAKVHYRNYADSGLIALHLTQEAGVSIQWSEQGYSAWIWTPESNRRWWPGE